MLIIGIAFLALAALLQFTSISVIGAAALVGAACVVWALVNGERFPGQK